MEATRSVCTRRPFLAEQKSTGWRSGYYLLSKNARMHRSYVGSHRGPPPIFVRQSVVAMAANSNGSRFDIGNAPFRR
jgi:hypothetical protein